MVSSRLTALIATELTIRVLPPRGQPIFTDAFSEITALLLFAAALGGVAVRLRQPLILAFVAVGVAVSPSALGWIGAHEQVELLAKLGISLLLFVVGLRLDLLLIRRLGVVAVTAGVAQIAFSAGIGFLLALALGLETTAALHVAVALTFSSTIIVVKLLSDKREIDSLHGRIAVGILIVQDIAIVLVMIGMTAVGAAAGAEGSALSALVAVLLKGAVLLGVLGLLARYVLPRLLHQLARSSELLVLAGIAWAVALAALGDYLGFSKEVGAFLAGVSIASTHYREAISARLVSLRDFLLLFFFVSLGLQLDLQLVGAELLAAVVLSAFVLVVKPLIVVILMGMLGYRKRTGFLTGVSLAQISEFSFILGALGVTIGYIGRDTLGLITLIGLVTIALSSYLILYSHRLYEWLAPRLDVFERKVPHREQAIDQQSHPLAADVILFGLGRFGGNLARHLREHGISVLGVDFDPQAVRAWRRMGLAAQYGDAEDPEFAATLPLTQARWVVSTAPPRDVSLALLHGLQTHGFRGHTALTAHSEADAELLRQKGANVVFLPFADAAEQAADVIVTESTPSAGRHL
jgi:Kef-type K+ transport system membrane component KefB